MRGSSSSVMAKESVAERWEDDIVRSCEDKRLYRYLLLKNGLKAFIISDSTTDKSAASMNILVGSMSDPWTYPGLAHFCEHMLFLGTEKFPSENEYNKYLAEHSGGSNAFTASDHTNYYFDVAPDAFKGALDRFAQFFLCPLFTESCVEREVNAVHSEHEKNVLNDFWRMDQLEKSTCNPEHPYSKFGTGNKTTLFDEPNERGECVRDALLQFHKEWYSANAMGLTVLGKESLDELEEMVVELFSGVENKNVTVPTWSGKDMYSEQPHTGYIVPVKDIRHLHITWPFPDLRAHYKSGPGYYLSHLIGHEGKGSLLSYLKSQGWVNSLAGGHKNGPRGFSFFCVNVDLTEEGIDHVDDIAKATFQYLNLMREAGAQQWIFEELQKITSISFRFKDKERPQSYVTGVAESLHYYPPEEILSGAYLLTEFNAPLISSMLELLTPEKARLAVVGKQVAAKTTKTEKWYGTQYELEPVPEAMLEQWRNSGRNPALALPKPNPFIPENLELCTHSEGVSPLPQNILNTPLASVWFKQDTEYKLPKNNMYAELFSPIAYLNPGNTNLLHMLAQMFRDALTEYSYEAELADLEYSLNNSKYGLTLNVRGYSDKQPVFVREIMQKLVNFKVDPKRFAILKETYERALCNFCADQPHQHVVYYTSLLMSQFGWSKEDLLQAAKQSLTVEALEAFIDTFLSSLHVTLLVHGAVSRQWALTLAGLVTAPLEQRQPPTRPLLESQKHRQREIKLPKGSSHVYEAYNTVHLSSAVEVVLQGDQLNTKHNALFELAAQILAEPSYDELRTKEQLGYIVWSGLRRNHGTQGFRIIVQSPHAPEYLDQRIEAFFEKMKGRILEMSDEDFARHRDALIDRRLEKPKKMATLTMQWWTEIICNQYNFDRDNIEVECLRGTAKQELVDHYMSYIAAEGKERAKLSVQVLSRAEGGAGSEVPSVSPPTDTDLVPPPPLPQPTRITSVSAFKGTMSLFPLLQPYQPPASPTDSKAKL
ncbi:Peptidase M16 N-terminal [Trinorchestia longiramus]|nr:Peptidase M16 N-terminal [Trinorchestia longiramus]